MAGDINNGEILVKKNQTNQQKKTTKTKKKTKSMVLETNGTSNYWDAKQTYLLTSSAELKLKVANTPHNTVREPGLCSPNTQPNNDY